jgi:hypothetical protein
LGNDLLPTLSHWTEFEKSGYFAVMEQPKPVANDVRTFLRPLR